MERRALFVLGLVAFALIGAQQALYGPSFAALQARYAVDVGQVGAIVSAHFGGGLVGIPLVAPLLRRWGYRRLVPAAATTVAVGLALVVVAPAWFAALAAAAAAGLGFGMLVALLNLAFARAFGARSAAALGVLNASFGIGAMLGPVPIAVALERGLGAGALAPAFFGWAAVAALVALAAARTGAWPDVPAAAAADAAPVRWDVVAAFGLALALYVAVESNAAAWAPTHLALQLDVGRAALATSLFWGAVTVGRLAAAAFAGRVPPPALVLGAALAAVAGLALAHVPGLGLAAYALVGLAVAPVFPGVVAWLARAFPARVERVAPVVLACGNLGPVVGAPAVGAVVAWAGPAAVPSVLLALAGAFAALVWGLRRATRA